MARTVNEKDYALKRNQILDVTQRLIYTKGYEQMAIQDILDELQISKGAFYHYFDSKPALLEALIERIGQEALQLLNPIVQDPHLGALEKLQRYIDTGVRWKTARKTFMIELLRVWYADHNAVVRQKILAMWSKHALPLLTEIFHQGIREGVLNIPFPDQVGAIFMSFIQGLSDAFAELLLTREPRGDELQRAERLVAAYNDALERVLGAPAGSLQLMDAESLEAWFVAPSDNLAAEVSATSNMTQV
ncbi:MAG TPA: TetR/AcrR family transcriptional regulator [Roseiflexaceae bacterium]|nr:TetR/AcrR family transcriptional regulator [Roseiflexaceae bacterium]